MSANLGSRISYSCFIFLLLELSPSIFYFAFRFSLFFKFLVRAFSPSIYVVQLFNQNLICIGCDVSHPKANNIQSKCPHLNLQWSIQNYTAQNSQSMDTILYLVVWIAWYKWKSGTAFQPEYWIKSFFCIMNLFFSSPIFHLWQFLVFTVNFREY